MNKEQEQLQSLGFFGILKESIKIILSCPKLFTKITFAFIIPFNLFAIANLRIFKSISPERNLFYVFHQAVCFIFAFQFSLFSISAVVYTAGCTYTNNEVTFRKILSISLKVQKRLMATMLSHSMFSYVKSVIISLITFLIIFVLISGFSSISSDVRGMISILTMIMVIFIFMGGLHMIMYDYCKLDNIVTVFENDYGFKAMERSKELIKGNIGTSAGIPLVQLLLCSMPIYVLVLQYILSDGNVGFRMKIVYGIVFLVLNPLIMLYSLVVQTIFYFVCKSYHHESVDNLFLIDHLDVSKSDEDYVPLKNDDDEIERLNV